MGVPSMQLLAAQTAASGAFDPGSITGLELWLDSDDASTFTYSSGTLVSQWDDKSGNTRHVVQANASLQPSRSATYGSLTAVRFTSTSNHIMRTSSASTISQPYNVFAVSAILGATRSLARILSHRSTLNVQFVQGELSSNFSAYAGTGFVTSGSVPTTGVLQQGSATINGTSSVARSNGTAGSTGNAGSQSLDLVTIGASGNTTNWFNGDIAEILVYSGSLSTTDRDAIEGYLATKWGTP